MRIERLRLEMDGSSPGPAQARRIGGRAAAGAAAGARHEIGGRIRLVTVRVHVTDVDQVGDAVQRAVRSALRDPGRW
jgi:hypothetical protein